MIKIESVFVLDHTQTYKAVPLSHDIPWAFHVTDIKESKQTCTITCSPVYMNDVCIVDGGAHVRCTSKENRNKKRLVTFQVDRIAKTDGQQNVQFTFQATHYRKGIDTLQDGLCTYVLQKYPFVIHEMYVC